jgi:hypothetical protein
MNKLQTFQQFLAASSVQVSIFDFLLNMILATILSFLLSKVYQKFGTSLSNRHAFGKNFILITMATMLVISIVKSSLALSLGLVGALSIVRFRTALKEPEELAYMFLSIAIGLGFGADQRTVTIVALTLIIFVVILRNRFSKSKEQHNMHLTVYQNSDSKTNLDSVSDILKKNCDSLSLKRLEESNKMMEAIFLIEFSNFSQLERAKKELLELNESLKISFLDQTGVI